MFLSSKRQLHRNCITFVWFFVTVTASELKSEIFIFKSITLKIKITLKEEIFPRENYFHKRYVKLP